MAVSLNIAKRLQLGTCMFKKRNMYFLAIVCFSFYIYKVIIKAGKYLRIVENLFTFNLHIFPQ